MNHMSKLCPCGHPVRSHTGKRRKSEGDPDKCWNKVNGPCACVKSATAALAASKCDEGGHDPIECSCELVPSDAPPLSAGVPHPARLEREGEFVKCPPGCACHTMRLRDVKVGRGVTIVDASKHPEITREFLEGLNVEENRQMVREAEVQAMWSRDVPGAMDPNRMLSRADHFRLKVAGSRATLAARALTEKNTREGTPIDAEMDPWMKLAMMMAQLGEVTRAVPGRSMTPEERAKLRAELDTFAGLAMMWRASLL